MMKQTISTLALCAAFLFALPLSAQDSDKEDLKNKTDEQLAEEMNELKKDISKSMGKVEDRLREVALGARKPDELRADLEKMIEQLKLGEADEMHEGLQEKLKAEPEKLAEMLKLSNEEAKKLLENEEELLKRLSENAEKTEDLFKDLDFKKDVLERQAKLERDMQRMGKAQEKGKQTEGGIRKFMDNLQERMRRAKPKAGESKPGEKKPGEKKPGEGEEGDEPNGQKPGEEIPKPGEGKEKETIELPFAPKKPDSIEEKDPTGDAADIKLQGKKAQDRMAKDAKRKRDPRYDGMRRVFDRMRKKLAK